MQLEVFSHTCTVLASGERREHIAGDAPESPSPLEEPEIPIAELNDPCSVQGLPKDGDQSLVCDYKVEESGVNLETPLEAKTSETKTETGEAPLPSETNESKVTYGSRGAPVDESEADLKYDPDRRYGHTDQIESKNQTVMVSSYAGYKPNPDWIRMKSVYVAHDITKSIGGGNVEFQGLLPIVQAIYEERFARRKTMTGPRGTYAKYSLIPDSATQLEGECKLVAVEALHRYEGGTPNDC